MISTGEKENKTDEFWTKPEARAKIKFTNKDIYVLTSNYTFSGAEEFSYNLKNLKRATIIGETTGGGAHPGGMVRLADHFGVFIPVGSCDQPDLEDELGRYRRGTGYQSSEGTGT